jgi:hypothetical protein
MPSASIKFWRVADTLNAGTNLGAACFEVKRADFLSGAGCPREEKSTETEPQAQVHNRT